MRPYPEHMGNQNNRNQIFRCPKQNQGKTYGEINETSPPRMAKCTPRKTGADKRYVVYTSFFGCAFGHPGRGGFSFSTVGIYPSFV